VYRLIASQGVKVTLSGQGADECLTGYRGALPALHAELLRRRKWQALHQALKLAAPAAPLAALGSPLRLLLRGLVPQAAYKAWTRVRWQRQFRDGGLFCLSALGPAPVLPPPLPHARGFAERSVLHGYLYSLLCGSSLSTILRYEDRNSMAASVEARAPFLDHRVVEHCLGRPPEELVQNGLPKALLRRALGSRLPPIVAARRDKVGFAAPEARWLRGPLEPLVLDLLHSQTMRQRGLYDCDALLRMLRTTAAWPAGAMSPRSSEQSYDLWKALNTELWLREHALSL
jgi:asparagine synthase (glutamine-hydrolysing)